MSKNRVGRPSVENKREALTVRLIPEVRDWLKGQNTSAGAIIEELVQEQMDRDNDQVEMEI